jgi:hypothetical protein
MPHKHPEDRVYTVMSGAFYIGLGDRFDADRMNAYPPGSVLVLPGDTFHFHWAKSGEYITQVAFPSSARQHLPPGADVAVSEEERVAIPLGHGVADVSGSRDRSGER